MKVRIGKKSSKTATDAAGAGPGEPWEGLFREGRVNEGDFDPCVGEGLAKGSSCARGMGGEFLNPK